MCKSLLNLSHAGAHPHPLAHIVPSLSIVWLLVAGRIWRNVLERCMWKRYLRERSPVSCIGLSWLLPCIVTSRERMGVYSRGGLERTSPDWFFLNNLIRRGKYGKMEGDMTPEGVNYTVLSPLSWQVKLFHCLLRKDVVEQAFLKTVIAEQSVSQCHSWRLAGFTFFEAFCRFRTFHQCKWFSRDRK